jgi:chemotaxis protein histidine kinase CheA
MEVNQSSKEKKKVQAKKRNTIPMLRRIAQRKRKQRCVENNVDPLPAPKNVQDNDIRQESHSLCDSERNNDVGEQVHYHHCSDNDHGHVALIDPYYWKEGEDDHEDDNNHHSTRCGRDSDEDDPSCGDDDSSPASKKEDSQDRSDNDSSPASKKQDSQDGSYQSQSDSEDEVYERDDDEEDEDPDDLECIALQGAVSSCPTDKEIRNHIMESLQPLRDHMSSVVGGELSTDRMQAISKRATTLILWSSAQKSYSILESTDAVLHWVGIFILNYYCSLVGFCTYLSTTEILAPTTILNWLNDLTYFFKWYSYFSDFGREQTVNPSQLQPVLQTIAALRKSLSKSIKKMKSKRTLQTAIELRRIPEQGIKVLQDIVEGKMNWVRSLVIETFVNAPSLFLSFMRLMYAAIYTSMGQGRVSGVQDMKYGQRVFLSSAGYAASNQFKTYSSFGYQIVSLAGNSLEIFEKYIKVARPFIEMKLNISPKDNDPLFINANGEAEQNVSRQVTAFFKEYNYHISTTALRSMVEMQTNDLYHNGLITLGEREAVANTSGEKKKNLTYYVPTIDVLLHIIT